MLMGDDEDEDDETSQKKRMGKIEVLTQYVRKEIRESLFPAILSARSHMERLNKNLLGPIGDLLVSTYNEYKSDISAMLIDNPELVRELEFQTRMARQAQQDRVALENIGNVASEDVGEDVENTDSESEIDNAIDDNSENSSVKGLKNLNITKPNTHRVATIVEEDEQPDGDGPDEEANSHFEQDDVAPSKKVRKHLDEEKSADQTSEMPERRSTRRTRNR